MADSSSEELYDDAIWVFYKDRVNWKDVTPVPQDDGPHPVVAISYTEKFVDVYNYFRAILKSGEKSERALHLTKDALDLNPANYTVWQYRRELLKHLGKDLTEELEYVKAMIEENTKNYQVWHHRRVISEWLNNGSSELELTEAALSLDAKNYHAWQHRQWAIRHFKLYDGELNFVDRLLDDDVRNNSAWNQRYFVLKHTTGFTPDIIRQEVEYTKEKIRIASNNESAWNYLDGILLHAEQNMAQQLSLQEFCEELYGAGSRSPYLLAFMVNLLEDQIEQQPEKRPELLQKALALCDALAKEHDVIRVAYWKYIARVLASKASANNLSSDTRGGGDTI
ncbi:protein farnesyltransferase/geranylgeranyltransferase type-1 subunit alpha [Schistocerca americana]|uniref:protein farnesyltransferase/geranylgeranyltransferase type-1 subunit alpha n=1 Tax=Schistocerca americana TaxID=7009 RepID=UPI001F4FA3A2|nr:protein farnesyltransferase/geranylgeranyltransferase type-1 subunit alpha [Schistocerca americana]XP_049938438.1 protein farnesyltransferase/geranylgeranyltransferase type-1 subunit alpha [Schistocerca serialis cubense]